MRHAKPSGMTSPTSSAAEGPESRAPLRGGAPPRTLSPARTRARQATAAALRALPVSERALADHLGLAIDRAGAELRAGARPLDVGSSSCRSSSRSSSPRRCSAAWATKNAQGVEVSDGRVSFNTTESNRCWPCKFRHCEAAAWRKRLAGKANASDTEVKAALLRLVRGGQLASLPKTNEHVRDAIGVALWAWWGSR